MIQIQAVIVMGLFNSFVAINSSCVFEHVDLSVAFSTNRSSVFLFLRSVAQEMIWNGISPWSTC